VSSLPQRSMRESVERLEGVLLQMPQADIKTTHVFKDGVYERAITVPPWTVLTGAEHRTPYKVRLEQGAIAVNTDYDVHILQAPYEFDAPAGVKRVGRVFDETVVWVDVYDNPDNCTDIPTLEARLYVVPDEGMGETRRAARLTRDRVDYEHFLVQMGMTPAEMDAIVKDERDLIPMPDDVDVEVRESSLHGRGLFALREFAPGEHICPGRMAGCRTPAGRFTNHSAEPNAAPTNVGDDIGVIAVRRICPGDEITVDYRASMRVNFGIELQGEFPCLDG
jgi:hypothetical protein